MCLVIRRWELAERTISQNGNGGATEFASSGYSIVNSATISSPISSAACARRFTDRKLDKRMVRHLDLPRHRRDRPIAMAGGPVPPISPRWLFLLDGGRTVPGKMARIQTRAGCAKLSDRRAGQAGNPLYAISLISDPREREPFSLPHLHSWTALHFEHLLGAFHASVEREPLIPAGAPLDHRTQ
jgi:hypothetical protein